jgi:rhamnose utilization protein RhaD (predicted bifunctional aldolase and dehydrogenase)/NAD(P)-dependent dehydrogenase (short-subunit alcohol dehydrogenase family)
MESRWSDAEAARFIERLGCAWGEDLALRTYSSRLLGGEPSLVLHGGGNTSVKGTAVDLFGVERPALFVKASGCDLARAEPGDHVAVDLERARRLLGLGDLDDRELLRALRAARLDPDAPHPSIETPVHAVLPARFVDHTHADAVLALTNRPDGEAVARAALGDDVIVLPYRSPGLPLAQAVAEAIAARPEARAMVWMRHGLTTWGGTARESYERMIELVTRAEAHVHTELERARGTAAPTAAARDFEAERRRVDLLGRLGPALRGTLAAPSADPDRPWCRVVLRVLDDAWAPDLLARPGAREALDSPVLTADHLVRTGPWPLWLEAGPDGEEAEAFRERVAAAVAGWRERYRAYAERHRDRLAPGVAPPDPAISGPRVVLAPGLGVLATGATAAEADVARDVARRTLAVKAHFLAAGVTYEGLAEEHLFEQEHRPLQRAKLARSEPPLARTVALVTGAAGAIGSGIARGLLEAGAHLAATDLAGERLDALAQELAGAFPGRALGVPMDVTDPESVAAAFAAVAREWGGVDLIVVNAGAAHVASLEALALADFERLERINVHGTLLVLAEAARRLRLQGTGGDVVLVSTKNVFAPGASFGAYSATKAAAHQLARVASQELAPLGVRVNMVAPDAVFSEGERRSGLWAEVGPERMRARGLTEEGLEEYYRGRNLLKARITARHVANAVLYYATRQSPTTGATIPVDGGLPDATPR